jgi:hypothetical protein
MASFRNGAVGALPALLVLALLAPSAVALPRQSPSASLLHFTDDLTATGQPLFPGFLHHSMWSALGRASNGKIYLGVSNHQDPGGNAALFSYDPALEQLRLIGDLQGASSSVENWMSEESQYKIHTFLLEHADGRLYFASQPDTGSDFVRGAHLYRIDPTTDEIEDVSKTQPLLMTGNLEVIANPGLNQLESGVFIADYAIKGIGRHHNRPNLLYAMTWPEGHLIRHDLIDGSMAIVGQSSRVAYVFHVDAYGNVYYADSDGSTQTLYKYDDASGSTTVIATGIADGEIGAIAPSKNERTVYFLVSTSRAVYVLDTVDDTFSYLSTACGTNWWQLFNLSLSPDEGSLYFVSNNNDRSTIRRIDTTTGACSEVLDVDALVGSRNLCFGGVGVWDADGAFYAPVWTHLASPPDLAVIRVEVEEPSPACSDGIDNDGDGSVDFLGGDPGCDTEGDGSERSAALPCDDGADNDGDGGVDFDPVTFADPGDATTAAAGSGDPGCKSPRWNREDPACQDGISNDADAGIDYDGGLSLHGSADPAGADPDCIVGGRPAPWRRIETRQVTQACGLGFELVLVLPLWLQLRRKNDVRRG